MTDPVAAPAPSAAPAASPAAASPASAPAAEQTSLLGAPAPAPAPTSAPAPAEQADSAKAGDAGQKPQDPDAKYEFKAVEGHDVDPAVAAAFCDVTKELGIPLEQAQKVLDKMAPAFAQRQQAQLLEAHNTWLADTKAHPEFGGAKFEESLGHAQKAVSQFGGEQFRSLLDKTGLGSHPEVFAFMAKVGKAVAEDKVVVGGAPTSESQSLASRLYPSQSTS